MPLDAQAIAKLLPPHTLVEDPDQWLPPTSEQIRLIVGRGSATGVSGAIAARLIGTSSSHWRKYTATERANVKAKIPFAAWHLLLHKLGIKKASTIQELTPKKRPKVPDSRGKKSA